MLESEFITMPESDMAPFDPAEDKAMIPLARQSGAHSIATQKSIETVNRVKNTLVKELIVFS